MSHRSADRDGVQGESLADAAQAHTPVAAQAHTPVAAQAHTLVATQAQAQASVVIEHEGGLHARPAVTLTKLAKTFSARILLAADADGPWVDAKSVVKVMAMKTRRGVRLHVQAQGTDAETAVAALVTLVEQDFAGGPD